MHKWKEYFQVGVSSIGMSECGSEWAWSRVGVTLADSVPGLHVEAVGRWVESGGRLCPVLAGVSGPERQDKAWETCHVRPLVVLVLLCNYFSNVFRLAHWDFCTLRQPYASNL